MCLTTPETTLFSTNFTVLYGHRPPILHSIQRQRRTGLRLQSFGLLRGPTGHALRIFQPGGGRGVT